MQGERTITSIDDLVAIQQDYQKRLYYPAGIKVNIGMASCGIAAGAKASLERAAKELPLGNGTQLCQTGCIGFCEEEPLVEICAPGSPRVIYKHMTEDKICDAITGYEKGDYNKKWLLGQLRDPRSLLETEIDNPLADVTPLDDIPFVDEIPFYHKQIKIALRNCGYIDPDSIEEYIARGGYRAFLSTLAQMEPKEIIATIKESGL